MFDESTLPAALRRKHRTKPGVWGVIRVLEGRLRYQVLDPVSEVILDLSISGLVLPEVPHLVESLGPMRMQVKSTISSPNCNGQLSCNSLPLAKHSDLASGTLL